MSWSVDYIGTPAKVAEALEKHSSVNGLTGTSLAEYEAAKPALVNLVRLNFNTNYPGFAVRVVAGGHASNSSNGGYSNCSVKIEQCGNVVT